MLLTSKVDRYFIIIFAVIIVNGEKISAVLTGTTLLVRLVQQVLVHVTITELHLHADLARPVLADRLALRHGRVVGPAHD